MGALEQELTRDERESVYRAVLGRRPDVYVGVPAIRRVVYVTPGRDVELLPARSDIVDFRDHGYVVDRFTWGVAGFGSELLALSLLAHALTEPRVAYALHMPLCTQFVLRVDRRDYLVAYGERIREWAAHSWIEYALPVGAFASAANPRSVR